MDVWSANVRHVTLERRRRRAQRPAHLHISHARGCSHIPLQVYRGSRFNDLFTAYGALSTRPLLVTEFGVDAFDSRPFPMEEDQTTQARRRRPASWPPPYAHRTARVSRRARHISPVLPLTPSTLDSGGMARRSGVGTRSKLGGLRGAVRQPRLPAAFGRRLSLGGGVVHDTSQTGRLARDDSPHVSRVQGRVAIRSGPHNEYCPDWDASRHSVRPPARPPARPAARPRPPARPASHRRHHSRPLRRAASPIPPSSAAATRPTTAS